IPPRDERAGQQGNNLVVLLPIPDQQVNSSAVLALNRAQGESTFASVRI
ncbi:MAG: GlxA family transcriptional regulator, partial [Pseudomonadales bacterium]